MLRIGRNRLQVSAENGQVKFHGFDVAAEEAAAMLSGSSEPLPLVAALLAQLVAEGHDLDGLLDPFEASGPLGLSSLTAEHASKTRSPLYLEFAGMRSFPTPPKRIAGLSANVQAPMSYTTILEKTFLIWFPVVRRRMMTTTEISVMIRAYSTMP